MNMNAQGGRFAQLVIFDRGYQIKTVLMNQPQVTIGRTGAASTCDVMLDSALVSSNHGTFTYYNGEYYYTDGINVNGTFINGVKIKKNNNAPSAAHKLRDGDILTIGINDISKEKTVYILFSTSTRNDYVWEACSLNLPKSRITIGRDPSASDIVVSELSVSRVHAYISRDANGKIYITDNKSVNGTIVNGTLLRSGETKPFNERDTVIVGSTKIINLKTALIYSTAKSINHREPEFPQRITPKQNSVWIEDKPIQETPKSVHVPQPPNNGPANRVPANVQARRGGVELRVENLSKIVPCKKGTGINGGDKKYILQNVSLTIYPGELVAILGGSGAGKTTLMNAINGFEPATSGSVYFNGTDLYKNYQAYKAQIGYVPQQDIVYDNLTMFDMLAYVAKLRLPKDVTKSEIEQRVMEVLHAMALEKQKDTLIKKLSGGQRKRASIAVELISDPALFFLDEPTSGLDPEAETNLMKQLQMLSAQRGKTILVITHTLQNIHLFDKVIFMAPGGSLCFYGSPDEAKTFFEVDNLSDAYEKISADVNMYVSKYNRQRTN